MTKKYEFIECRAIGHSWMPGFMDRKPEFGIMLDFLCIRCHTTRRDIYTRTGGRLIGRHYDYPENYHTEKTDKTEWREKYLKQLSRRERAIQKREST